MNDFVESVGTFLLGVCLGIVIGMIALGILMDKNYQKFCPQCGQRYKNEEIYCSNDGAELLTISSEVNNDGANNT